MSKDGIYHLLVANVGGMGLLKSVKDKMSFFYKGAYFEAFMKIQLINDRNFTIKVGIK